MFYWLSSLGVLPFRQTSYTTQYRTYILKYTFQFLYLAHASVSPMVTSMLMTDVGDEILVTIWRFWWTIRWGLWNITDGDSEIGDFMMVTDNLKFWDGGDRIAFLFLSYFSKLCAQTTFWFKKKLPKWLSLSHTW